MYIIDKNKDYYDYYKGIYGIDKTIIYDRRNSRILNNNLLIKLIQNIYNQIKEKSFEHFILEVGYTQYFFRVEVFRKDTNWYPDIYQSNFELVKIFKDNKHYFDKEISIVSVDFQSNWKWKWDKKKYKQFDEVNKFSDLKIHSTQGVKEENPIIGGTSISSFIDPKDIWIELSNFISSKYNDKTILIKNSDTDILINHGFDKKSSFRHPVK